MSNVLNKSIGRVRSATKSAFQRNKNMLGGTQDKQLSLYEKMKPQDFNSLAELYGGDSVISYIQHMEARRLIKEERGTNG